MCDVYISFQLAQEPFELVSKKLINQHHMFYFMSSHAYYYSPFLTYKNVIYFQGHVING